VGKIHYRTIWISDTHLCSQDCRADALLSFLKHNRCDNLYIVGDFIDIWKLKRKWHWPQATNDVIQKVLRQARKGTKVVFIPGNHDEMFREFVGSQFGGVEILQQAIHETADGKRLLVLHGDEFDLVVQHNKWLAIAGDVAYDWLVSANRILNVFRRWLRMPYWSLAACMKDKVKNAVKYIGDYENAVVREAKKLKMDGVVCGHIHQPTIKEINGIKYCNTGDWVENCSAVVEKENGEIELAFWPYHDYPLPADDD
jgi:UDP-2,3-diacylglucosamine pyrophosphatase LpxH